jgi:hypothetical protein
MSMSDQVRRRLFSGATTLSEVPRVASPPSDVFEHYFVGQGAPIIITGSPIYANGVRTLDDLLNSDAASIQIRVRSGNYLDVGARKQEWMKLSDYVGEHVRPLEQSGSSVGGNLPKYAGNTMLDEEAFAALGFVRPPFFNDRDLSPPRLWFGPKGSATPLHYDTQDNVMCQYMGTKRLTLYPPSQIPYLYTRGYGPAWSRVADPRHPDFDRYPLFEKAKPVENLETSMMVNFWPEYTRLQEARVKLLSSAYALKRRLGG